MAGRPPRFATWPCCGPHPGRDRQTLQRVSRELQLVEPKTSRIKRTVPLPRIAVQALREERKRQLAERLAAGTAWEGEHGQLVFASLTGEPVANSTVTQRFQRDLAAVGLPRFRFHDLRHIAATPCLSVACLPAS